MGLLFLIFPFFLFSQTLVYVDADANGSNNGNSWANAYTELRLALANTTCGVATEFRIAQGTYFPTSGTDRNASFTLCNNWKLVGGYASGGGTLNPLNFPTRLSGDIGVEGNLNDNVYHVIRITNADETLQLEGLQIIDGNASGTGEDDKGGGVYINGSGLNNSATPSFKTCIFRGNKARNGGAVYNNGTNNGEVKSRFDNCLFIENQGDIGGAVYNIAGNNGKSSPVFTSCTFLTNTAQFSGGAINESSSGGGVIGATYLDCLFEDNWAVQFNGGAMSASGFDGNFGYYVDRCRFNNNRAGDNGGAVYALTPKSSFSNSIFTNNQAARGGAFYISNTIADNTLLSLNNTFYGNTGSGAVVFYDQTNAGVASANFTNCIIWGNASVAGTSGNGNVGHINISNSIIQGGSWQGSGNSNSFSDPLFINAPDNLRLNVNSPAVNSGNNNVPVFADLDGNLRPQGGTLDLGAYESAVSADGLSLDWVSFNVKQQEQSTRLDWTTANEKDNLGFQIERANANHNFSIIGEVKAKNTAFARYSFIDKNPLSGINYYRIVQRDTDGTITYSAVQSVFFDKNNTVQVFPNPTANFIQITGLKNENIIVQLFDMQQQLISQTTDLQQIKLPNSGVYMLKIYQNQQLIKVEKVVRY